MLHAVLFLVATCQLVLLDRAVHVVLDVGADDEAVLRLACSSLQSPKGGISYCLGIDVVVLILVLYEPSLVLEHLELPCSFLIDARVVLAGAYGEVDLGLDDVIERLFVVASLGTSFLALEDVIRA